MKAVHLFTSRFQPRPSLPHFLQHLSRRLTLLLSARLSPYFSPSLSPNVSRQSSGVVSLAFSLALSGALPAAAAAAPPAATPANAAISQISAMLAKPPVLCGSFEQSKQLSGIKKPLLSTGRFCVVQGKGVLWRTLKPFPNTLRLTRDEIVQFQGERVAMRLAAQQEPTVRMINSVLFSLLAGDLAQLDKLFDVEGSVAGKGAARPLPAGAEGKADSKPDGKPDSNGSWQVALKAREPALARAIGTIALDGGAYVKHITMQEASGDRTQIEFLALQSGEAAMLPEEMALLK